MKKSLLFLAFLAMSVVVFGQTLGFHEDFELPSSGDSVTSSGTPGANMWAINTALYAAPGVQSFKVQISQGDTIYLTSNAFSTVGNSAVLLSFDHICKIEFSDAAEIEVSNDNGLTWTKLTGTQYTGAGQFGNIGNKFTSTSYVNWLPANPDSIPTNSWWKNESFDIGLLVGNASQVKIRFMLRDANNSGPAGNFGWVVDNINVIMSFSEMNAPVLTMIPPIIQDTAYTAGPYLVRAKVTDQSGLDTVYVAYTVSTGLIDTIGMTMVAPDTFAANIPFYGFGKKIYYHVVAIDGSLGMNQAQSSTYSFYCKFSSGGTYQIGTGTSVSTGFPCIYGQYWSGDREQHLILASELQAVNMVPGPISAISFFVVTPNGPTTIGVLGNNHNNLTIKLKNTSVSALNSTSLESGLTQVFTVPSYQTVTGWNTHTFQTPFVWDGVSNLLVESCFDNYVTGYSYSEYAYVNYTTTPFTSVAYYYSDNGGVCPNPTPSSTSSNRVNMKFEVTGAVSLSIDAGVGQYVSPTGGVVANTTTPVQVRVKNFGTDTLFTAQVNWTIDGVVQTPFLWSDTLLKDSLSTPVLLGNINVTAGAHQLKAWTDNPNGTTDLNSGNDTLILNFFACANLLSGTYTIGGTGADFATFNDALMGLIQCGIIGPVIFNVAAGTYNEQLMIPAINGASATNTVTFKSAANDSTSVLLSMQALNSAGNYLVNLNGSSFIIFRNIKFVPLDSNFATAVLYTNGAQNNSLIGNYFIGKLGTSENLSLIRNQNVASSNNLIQGNRFEEGSYPIYMKGVSAANLLNGISIIGNTISGYRLTGIRGEFVGNMLVEGNTITTSVSNTGTTQGINLIYATNNSRIIANKIVLSNSYNTNGIQLNNCTGYDSLRALIANNFISILNGTNLTYGIRLMSSTYQDIYYNSLNIVGNSNTDTRGINPWSSGNIRVLNNNIQSNKYPTFYEGTAVTRSDYNNLYSTTNLYGYYPVSSYVNFTSLAAYKAATNLDSNSVSFKPYFNSNTDLHTFNGLLNGIATPLTAVSYDIDGELRNAATPDIGADEFDPPAIDVTVLDILEPVGGCRLDSTENVTIRIKNIGTDTVSSGLTAYFRIGTTTPVSEPVTATILPGDTLVYTFNATVMMDMTTFNLDSTFTFTAWTTLTGDPVPYNDTAFRTVVAKFTPVPPTASGVSIPYGNTATLNATHPNIIRWWASDTSTVPLGQGPSFTTPPLYTNTTYWVGATVTTSVPGSFTAPNGFSGTTSCGGGFMIDITAISDNITLNAFDLNCYSTGQQSVNVYYKQGTWVGFTTNQGAWTLQGTYSVNSAGGATNMPITSLTIPVGQTYGIYLQYYSQYGSISTNATYTNGQISVMTGMAHCTNWDGCCTPRDWNGAVYYTLGGMGCESHRTPVLVTVGPPPGDEAGITQIVHPATSVPSGVTHPINVKLKNFGSDTLNTVAIGWELNTIVQTSFNWVGSLLPDSSLVVTIDSMLFAGGVYCIKSWTSMPNGVADIITTNDTSDVCFNACLSGSYTIGPDSTDDFPSFNAAKNALVAAGVCGHVTFFADTGIYNEQLVIPAIPGASATSTITFQGDPSDSTLVTLQFSATGTANNWTIRLDGADYFSFRNMTIKANNVTYGRVVEMINGATYNMFVGNRLISAGTTSTTTGAIYDNTTLNNYNSYINNYMSGGYYTMYIYGVSSTSWEKGTVIKGNEIVGSYYYPIYVYYGDSVQIVGNYIHDGISPYSYGITMMYSNNGYRIEGNRVHLNAASSTASYGIRDYYNNYSSYNANPSAYGVIANNMISITVTTAGSHYGMYAYNSNGSMYYYNSVNISGTTSTGSNALYQYGATANHLPNNFRNNIWANKAGGYAAYFSTTSFVGVSDYNNFYTTASNLTYWGGARTSLAAHQTASGNDSNSVNLNPDYFSNTDLHLLTTTLSGLGIAVAQVTVDIDGEPRSLTPTIGADEVPRLPIDAGVAFVYRPNPIESEGVSIPVAVRIRNYGTDTLYSIPMNYYVPGTTISMNYTWTGTLVTGDTAFVTMPNMTVPAGNRQLCAKTVLSGDSNIFNDETCKAFYGTPIQDAFVTRIFPIDEGCGLGLDTISIKIKNIGWDTIPSGFTAKYMEEHLTAVSATVNQSIAPNDSITFTFPTLFDFSVTTTDSIYRIKAWTEVPADNVEINDTAYIEVKSLHIPPAPVTSNVTVPYASPATLTATSTTGDKLYWYDSPTSQNEIDTGSTYTTGLMYTTDTFWVEAKGGSAGGEFQIGNGTLVNTGTSYPTPFGNYYWGSNEQYLFRASELAAIGFPEGAITSLSFNVLTPGNNPLLNFTIKMGHTNRTFLDSLVTTGLNQVYTTAAHTHTAGWNTQIFQTPFVWNGVSNIIIDVCFNNTSYVSNGNAIVYQTATPFNSTYNTRADASGVCGNTTLSLYGAYPQRPNMKMFVLPSGCPSVRVPVIVTVGNPSACDVGVYEILEPVTAVNLGANEPVKIRVRNYGTQPASNIPVSYQVNSMPVVTDTVPGPIASSATADFTFSTTANLSSGGTTYSLKAWTSLACDITQLNDTAYETVTNQLPNYCACAATSTGYEDISRVKVANLDNSSGAPGAMYTDFTNLSPALLAIGAVDSILVETAFPPSYTYQYGCWVNAFADWNRDGVLDPVTERFFSMATTSQNSVADTFTVPIWANPGLTLMRVVMRESGTAANTGPCGTFTWGEAEDYYVLVQPMIANDAGVIAITSPGSQVSGGVSEPVKALVRNFGSATILPGQLQVKYQLDAHPVVSVTVQATLQSFDTLTVNLGNLTIPTGQHQLCVWTVLASDSNTFNDLKCIGVFGQLYTIVPYSDNFEGTVYWNATGSKGNWQHGVPAGTTINTAHSPVNVWMTKLSSNYDNSAEEMLHSPRFDFSGLLPADTATLKFWHWMSSEANNDGGHLQYSLNSGLTWINLGFIGDLEATNWYNTNIGGTHCFSGSSSGWQQSTYKLPPSVFNGLPVVQFRFRFFSNASNNSYDGWAIDDFEVTLPVFADDVGIETILNPTGGTILGSQVSVTARLKNYGFNTQTSIPVSYSVNGGTPVSWIWTGSLAQNATTSYTFTVPFTSPSSAYQLCVKTSLPGDAYLPNNEICTNLNALPAPFDAGVVNVIHPKDTIVRDGNPKPVIIEVVNFGTSAITSMNLEYQINSLPSVVEAWTGTLNPGDTFIYQFNTQFMVPIGVFMMCSKTSLPFDANTVNDKSCNTVTSITGIGDGPIAGFNLGHSVPNPTNGLTTVWFELPSPDAVRFTVSNLLGQVMHHEQIGGTTGLNTIEFDASTLPAGTYYFSIEYRSVQLSRPMVVVR